MTPPSAAVTGACALAGLILIVLSLGEPTSPRAGRWQGLALAGLAMILFFGAGQAALRLPGIPYNVRELADRNATIALVSLGLVLLASGGIPAALASLWQQKPSLFAMVFVPLTGAIGSVVFWLVWPVVPLDSMDDIVGSPVLGIGGTLERWLRFVGLFAGPLAGLTLGARLALGSFQFRPMVFGAASIALALALSHIIVVPLAGTDNIVELLHGEGDLLAIVGIDGLLILLGVVVTHAARGFSRKHRHWLWSSIAPLLVVLLSVAVVWQLMVLGTNPRLDKYGKVFSARQFLFSPNRDTYLEDPALFPRFAGLYLALTAIFATGAACALRLSQAKTPDARRRR
jgi:hypothetical protein